MMKKITLFDLFLKRAYKSLEKLDMKNDKSKNMQFRDEVCLT